MLNKLFKHKHAWLFKDPVDPEALGIPDYFKVVKNPMDFSTIKSKLQGNKYLRIEDFIEDVNLTFDNCFLYNGENTQVGIMCKNVKEEYQRLYQQLYIDFYL